jgi:hypothetical protein
MVAFYALAMKRLAPGDSEPPAPRHEG